MGKIGPKFSHLLTVRAKGADPPSPDRKKAVKRLPLTENENHQLPVKNTCLADFGAGAMENWGLIAYREYALLYEEGKSPHMAFSETIHWLARAARYNKHKTWLQRVDNESQHQA